MSSLANPSSIPTTETTPQVHKGLASMFPNKPNEKTIDYQGMNGYSHKLELKRVYEMGNGIRFVNYEGWMADSESGSKEERKIYIDYYISDTEIIEDIKNLDKHHPEKSNTILSIIPKQIVLQAPLELNHSWTQEFEYSSLNEKNGTDLGIQRLTAKHTIAKVEQNKGKVSFTIETKVEGIKGYHQNTYKEVKVWETGKGLVSFDQSLPVYQSFRGNEENAKKLLSFHLERID